MDQERRNYCEACRRADPDPSCDDCPDPRYRPVPVLPANREAWHLFLACHTQQRQGALGGTIGLDYQGVAAAAAWLEIDLRIPRISDGLQQLEREWLQAIQKPRKRT